MAERRLIWLAVALLVAACAYMFWNLRGPMQFILTLRGTKLVALLLVGSAIGIATVLFQTVAQNRLLTPGIVGFDALFVALQSLLVLTLGPIGFAALPALARFGLEVAVLMGAAQLLFGVLLRKGAGDVIRMVLTGVILGVLLRGAADLIQRLLDPSAFAIVQGEMFASFTGIDKQLLGISSILLAVGVALAMGMAKRLDVALLGRTQARTLGLDHDRIVRQSLTLVSAFVAISTALIGPITFLGLLAASLAHRIMDTHRHALMMPAAGIIGALVLVIGQFVFERILHLQSTLAVLVEMFGGLLFLALVLRKVRT